MTDHTTHHTTHEPHKAAPAKAKPAPEPQKFSLIEYDDNDALAVEEGDWSGKKEDNRTKPARSCSCIKVFTSSADAHAELVKQGAERAEKAAKDAAKEKKDAK